MKTKTMIFLVILFYASLGLVSVFSIFSGIDIFGLGRIEIFSSYIVEIAFLSLTALVLELLKAPLYYSSSIAPRFRAFIMVSVGIFITSTIFIYVFFLCLFIPLEINIAVINTENQTEYLIYSIFVAWVITFLIYQFIHRTIIQKYTLLMVAKINKKITKVYSTQFAVVTECEKNYKNKVLQFYNSLGTLLGIGYGWFFIGTKDSIIDVFKSGTSMFTCIFCIGILAYVALTNLFDNDDLY